MKKCPFCAEEIQDEAIKCRFCNEFLDGRSRPVAEKKEEGVPFFFKTPYIIVGFCVAGPLVLPLIWFHPKYSIQTKVIFSLILIVITVLLGKLFLIAWGHVKEYFDMLQGIF